MDWISCYLWSHLYWCACMYVQVWVCMRLCFRSCQRGQVKNSVSPSLSTRMSLFICQKCYRNSMLQYKGKIHCPYKAQCSHQTHCTSVSTTKAREQRSQTFNHYCHRPLHNSPIHSPPHTHTHTHNRQTCKLPHPHTVHRGDLLCVTPLSVHDLHQRTLATSVKFVFFSFFFDFTERWLAGIMAC